MTAFFSKLRSWLAEVFSDGGKPSMARHLLVPLSAALIYVTVAEKTVPDNFTDIYVAVVAWAGGGTAVQRWVRNKVEKSGTPDSQ